MICSHLDNIFFEVSRKTTLWNGSGKKISLPAEIFARLQNLLHPSHTSPCFNSDVPDSGEVTSLLILSMGVVFPILV